MSGPVNLTLFLVFLAIPFSASSGDRWEWESDWGAKPTDSGERSSNRGPKSSDWGSMSNRHRGRRPSDRPRGPMDWERNKDEGKWPMSPKDKILSDAADWTMMMKGGKDMGKPSWDNIMNMLKKVKQPRMKDKWGDEHMDDNEDMWRKLMNMTDMGGDCGVNWDKKNDPEKKWKMKTLSKEKAMMDGAGGGNEAWKAMFLAHRMKGTLFWPGFDAKWNLFMKKAKEFMMVGQDKLKMELIKIKHKNKMKDMMGDGEKDTIGDWMKDKMGDWIKDKKGDGKKDNMGDWMKDMMGDGKKDNIGDWMKDLLGDGMKDKNGDGKKGNMGDWMKDIMGDGKKGNMGDWMKDILGDGIKDKNGDEMKDKMGDWMNKMGDWIHDVMGDGMKDKKENEEKDKMGDWMNMLGDWVHDVMGNGMKDKKGDEKKENMGDWMKDMMGDGKKDNMGDWMKDMLRDGMKDKNGDEKKGNMGDWMKDMMGDGKKDNMGDWMKDMLGEGIKDKKANETKDKMGDWMNKMGDWIHDMMGDGMKDKNGDEMKGEMGDWMNKMGDWVHDVMGDVMKDKEGDGMKDRMGNWMNKMGDWIHDIMGDGMKDKEGDGPKDKMGDWMNEMGDWVHEVMGDRMKDKKGDGSKDKMGDWMNEMGDWVHDIMGDGSKDKKGDEMKDKMGDWMNKMGDWIRDVMGDGKKDKMEDKKSDTMDMMDPMGGMDEEAYKEKVEMISMLLGKAGARGMDNEGFKQKVKDMLFSDRNKEDPLIDLNAPFKKEVHLQFGAPEVHFPLCGLEYRLPEVSQVICLKGETVMASDTRSFPRFFIIENGELVEDGLYTIIWVDRGEPNPEVGKPNEPFLQMMVTDIPGSDVSKGNFVRPYRFISFSGNMKIFLFKQSRYIADDIAIAKYSEDNNCQSRHRCRFRMKDFVKDFDLKMETVGDFKVIPDPASALFGLLDGKLCDKTACDLYLNRILVQAMKQFDVDEKSPEKIKKAWKRYTTFYIPNVAELADKQMAVLMKQIHALNETMKGKHLDNLIPPLTQLTHDVAFWYWSPPKLVGPLCGFNFELPEVDKFSYLKNDLLPTAVLRDAPRVKITNKKTGRCDKDKMFTVVLAERGFDAPNVGTSDKPFVQWIVTNIPGSDSHCGSTIIPYRGPFIGRLQQVFVYEQPGPVYGVAPKTLTTKKCRAPMRCAFEMKRFIEKYNLRLAAVGSYRATPDIWGAMSDMRMGNESPKEACKTYMKILKTKLVMKNNGTEAGSEDEFKAMEKALYN